MEIVVAMKERIVIIGANEFQNCLILKAKELGYETHVFAWAAGDIGEKNADFFYPISIVDKEKILEECKKIEPVAIVSIGSDLAVLTVNYVARELGLTANSEDCDRVSTNKYMMRRAFLENNIPTPRFIKVDGKLNFQSIQEFSYPLIAKPTDRSGSRGITKVLNESELEKAIKIAQDLSFEHSAIVEEFISGKEYSCECISYRGEHHFLALTEKFTTGSPHYIEIGHIQPAIVSDETKNVLKKTVYSALDALGIENGASHTELKIDSKGNIGIIEVGARMGGDCIGSDLVMLSTGNDFVKMVIDVACGNQPQIFEIQSDKNAAIRFIMEEDDLQLLETAKENLEVHRISEIDDNFSAKVEDSSSRYGHFIVTFEDRSTGESMLFSELKRSF